MLNYILSGGMVMNKNFEETKATVVNAEKLNDIWNNPVTQILVSGVSSIPVMGDIVVNTIGNAIEVHQRIKIQELLELILLDGTITENMINNVDVIMEFARLVDVVNKLRTNQKIEYLANLFKNTIKENEKEFDEYEEFLQKMNDLSYRELELLFLLEDSLQKNTIQTTNSDEVGNGFKPEMVWKCFLENVKDKIGLDDGVATSLVSGTMRSGFVQHISISYPGTSQTVFITTPYFRRFLEKINQR